MRVQRQKMGRKKRENFTRRRCWWSERRNEKGARDSDTKRERDRKRWTQRKEGFSRGNIHMRDRKREKERTQGLPLIRSSLPPKND